MKSSQLKWGIILSYGSMILSTLISLVYTPFMLRKLGQSEYGLYQIVYSVVNYLNLLNLGFSGAYIKFYTRYSIKNDEKGVKTLNGMFLLFYLCIAGIAIIIGTVLNFNLDLIFGRSLSAKELHTAKYLMSLMVINLAITFPATVFTGNISANEKFIFQRTVTLLSSILNPILSVILLTIGFKSIGLVIGATINTCLCFVINMYFCVKKLKFKFSFHNIPLRLFKEVAVFSAFILLSRMIDEINWGVGKVVLGAVAGTVEVSVFGLASQLNTYYLRFSTAISTVFIPKVNQIVEKYEGNERNQVLTQLFIKVGRLQFFVMSFILIGYIVFGQEFIAIWAGENYRRSYFAGLFLMIPVTVPLIQNIGIEIQIAQNKHKFRSLIYACIAICNIIISVILSQKIGAIGPAIATAISLLCGNGILMNIYYHKKIGLNIIKFWKNILKIIPSFIIPIIIGTLIKKVIVIGSYFALLQCGIIYSFAYCICVIIFAMNTEEKNMVLASLQKFIKREKNNGCNNNS